MPDPTPVLRRSALGITAGLIGWLIVVEITSGILQGYYVPLFSDIVVHLGITDADVNWFEAAQLLLSSIVVPVLAKLGDMYGHKKVLLIATVLTAGATWWVAFADNFWVFLIAWALQGFYVVWLPLEVAAAARDTASPRPAAPPACSSWACRPVRSSAPWPPDASSPPPPRTSPSPS